MAEKWQDTHLCRKIRIFAEYTSYSGSKRTSNPLFEQIEENSMLSTYVQSLSMVQALFMRMNHESFIPDDQIQFMIQDTVAASRNSFLASVYFMHE